MYPDVVTNFAPQPIGLALLSVVAAIAALALAWRK
jgi:hypothetical protein